MEFYLLRHGITELNKLKIPNGQIDEPLAPEGFEQIKQAIDLIPPSVTHIYVSPLLRARQTAEALNQRRKLPFSIHDEIRELNMGSIAGKAWENIENGLELRKKHRSLEYNYRPYGGESLEDFRERILRFLGEIKNKHKTKEVLIISHGGVVRLLAQLEYGTPLEETQNLLLYTFNMNKILKGTKA